MTNLLAQAINCDDADRAAKIIRDALGIESDDVVKYCFPTTGRPTASGAPVTSASGSVRVPGNTDADHYRTAGEMLLDQLKVRRSRGGLPQWWCYLLALRERSRVGRYSSLDQEVKMTPLHITQRAAAETLERRGYAAFARP